MIEIKYLNVKDLKAYEKNPRKNDKSVSSVAESIKDFGFKSPIIVDKDNVIICGHTRLKASKKLKLKTVPCIIADDLTEEQIKAYRLADNKVAEQSEWDLGLLNIELTNIADIDMSKFGFEIELNTSLPGPEETDFEGNERLRTDRAYNLEFSDLDRTAGRYQMPIIKKDNYIPKDLISFNYAKTATDKSVGIHFYIDDYQFERIWNNPFMYATILEEYDCMLTPDFSLYMDMPIALKIYNVYRSRLIGQIMQDYGIKVIPTISWAEKDTYDFCFDGIEPSSVVSISTIGVKRDDEAFEVWQDGVTEMIKRIKPKTILVYGGKVEYDYQGTDVIYYENKVTERMKGYKGKEGD